MSASTLSSTSSTTTTSQSQDNSLRMWRGLVMALGMVTLLAFISYVVLAVYFVRTPFIGAMVTHTMVVNGGQGTGNEAWAAYEAGLRRGDQIVGLNRADSAEFPPLVADTNDFMSARTRYEAILETLAIGDTVRLDFVRNELVTPLNDTICVEVGDGTGRCSIEIMLMPFPEIDLITYFILPFLAAIMILVIAGGVYRLRFDTPEGLLAISIALFSANFCAGIFDIGTDGLTAPVWLISAALLGGSLITLGMNFPKRLRLIRSVPWMIYLPISLSLLIGLVLSYLYEFPQDALSFQWATQAGIACVVVGIVTLLLLTIVQRERSTSPLTRDQSNTIFIGVVLTVVAVLFWIATRVITSQVGLSILFNVEAITVLMVLPNATIAYAVLQYRYLDTDNVISQGITYGILLGALIVAIYLLTLGGTLLFFEFVNARDILTISVILFFMVVGFTPIRMNLQNRIDKIYFRQRRDYQNKVEEFGRRLTNLNDYKDISQAFHQALNETISPSAVFIYLHEAEKGYVAYQHTEKTDVRFTTDSPLIALLKKSDAVIDLQVGQQWQHQLWADKARLTLIKAAVIKGMKSGDMISGFIVLAPPRVTEQYDHDDVRFLENLVNQLAIATERSRVIESLERRVRELDVLSQVGQAVNFTIEFDDLLELIYAQTRKLVDVPNFYIALYEERIQQMYFAFILEDEDRIEDKERVRWNIGSDLISEVTKKATALRVSNYQDEMKKRGATNALARPDLYGWMGVPLNAGRRTLGVMATGKSKDRTEYSEEQYKIFSDIGALAATSLDKANLFNQTKMRERQLTVLNDISRQLVATESDVEKLLQIIMNSAVDILNAEAGSLLLTAEDGSGDLEFRVVIGGAGSNLLGTRLPAGKGVVGEVMKTAQATIVNDAVHDPRHEGKIAESYISRSLLAVPLIAKNQTIGVLEVINKKDKTPFVEEDSELLTTFSGQAAIAIENARLFQQTDLQLSARLSELESIERIDNELNRTQDLKQVAEITVRSAMNILKADAGALGIVHLDSNILEIVAIKGYKENEYPDGADGLLWQLDKGIIGRVMRSRQADIAMDVVLDPDYNTGLTGSNSQITVPMLSGNVVNAILILEKNTAPRFSLPDWAFAQRIAEHASIAVANAQFYAALMQANHSKSEFMGFAAHELKNPLSSVKGYADVLISGMTGPLTDQQKGFVGIIKSNAERLQTIIDDLRDAARLDSTDEFKVDAAPINIHGVVVEALRPLIRSLEEKQQELINDVKENLPLVWADEKRVFQVLTNLVTNANKYSPPNRPIRLNAEVIENYYDQKGKPRGRMMQISIIDQGLGISESDQKRLFREQYFRSTNQAALDQPGTGLGMKLTKGIMDRHNGEIWLKSELGVGSTFFISFPLAEDMQKKPPTIGSRKAAESASD